MGPNDYVNVLKNMIKYNRLFFRMAKCNVVILQQGVLQGKIDSQDHVTT